MLGRTRRPEPWSIERFSRSVLFSERGDDVGTDASCDSIFARLWVTRTRARARNIRVSPGNTTITLGGGSASFFSSYCLLSFSSRSRDSENGGRRRLALSRWRQAALSVDDFSLKLALLRFLTRLISHPAESIGKQQRSRLKRPIAIRLDKESQRETRTSRKRTISYLDDFALYRIIVIVTTSARAYISFFRLDVV